MEADVTVFPGCAIFNGSDAQDYAFGYMMLGLMDRYMKHGPDSMPPRITIEKILRKASQIMKKANYTTNEVAEAVADLKMWLQVLRGGLSVEFGN